MATLEGAHFAWEGERDREGHREYNIKFKVRIDPDGDGIYREGPATALQTPGLPLPGDIWAFDDDVDVFAWCKNEVRIEPENTKKGNPYFYLTYTYSTKPDFRCQDYRIEDPLLEPQKISGSFIRYQEEAIVDRFGREIVNHAYEPIKGPPVTKDNNRPEVVIEQNVVELEFDLLCELMDQVNSAEIWDLPRRSVKLSGVRWERLFHGACQCYYKRTLTFDINVKTVDPSAQPGDPAVTSAATLVSGFDREILMIGTQVLNGYWDEDSDLWQLLAAGPGALDLIGPPRNPNPYNPNHYIRAVDRRDNPVRTITYDGRPDHRGEPYNPDDQVQYIDTCSECVSGAVEFWKVANIRVPGYNQPIWLSHQIDCTWGGTVTGDARVAINGSTQVNFIFTLALLSQLAIPSSPSAGNYFVLTLTVEDLAGNSIFLDEVVDLGSNGTQTNFDKIVWWIEPDDWNCADNNDLPIDDTFVVSTNPHGPLLQVILNYLGGVAETAVASLEVDVDSRPAFRHTELYEEGDLTRLNIPLSFDCNQ